jgi:hypothetical protein
MAAHSFIRIAAFVAVVAVSAATNGDNRFIVFTTILALSHYILAAIYSRKQFINATARPRPAVLFVLLIVAAVALYKTRALPLVLIFLPHQIFNEVYLAKQVLFPGFKTDMRSLTAASLILNTLLYCQMARFHHWHGIHFGSEILLPLATLSGFWFGFELWKRRRYLGWRGICNASVFELLGVTAVVIGSQYPITIWQLIAYHFIAWGFYPLVKMWDRHRPSAAVKYVLLNVITLAGVTLITPAGGLPWHLNQTVVDQLTVFFAILHIMISFATSRAQPEWIWRIFQPLPATSPAQAPILAHERSVVTSAAE